MTNDGLISFGIAVFTLIRLLHSQFSLLMLEVRGQRAEFIKQNKQVALFLIMSLGSMLLLAPALLANLFANLGYISLQNIVALLICVAFYSASDMIFDSFVRNTLIQTHIVSLPIRNFSSVLIFIALHLRLQLLLYTVVGLGLVWSLIVENNLIALIGKSVTFCVFIVNNILCSYVYSAKNVPFIFRLLFTLATQAIIFLQLWYFVIIQLCVLFALLNNRIRIAPVRLFGKLENVFIFDTWIGLSVGISLIYFLLMHFWVITPNYISYIELLSFFVLLMLSKGLGQLVNLFQAFSAAISYMPFASQNLLKKSRLALLLLLLCVLLTVYVTYFDNMSVFYLIASILFSLTGAVFGLHRSYSFIVQILIVSIFFMTKFT